MERSTPIIEYFGILTSMSWNSNKWAGEPTAKDIKVSNYGYVKEEAHMHESLNFGHDIYPAEEDGSYIGYSPILQKKT